MLWKNQFVQNYATLGNVCFSKIKERILAENMNIYIYCIFIWLKKSSLFWLNLKKKMLKGAEFLVLCLLVDFSTKYVELNLSRCLVLLPLLQKIYSLIIIEQQTPNVFSFVVFQSFDGRVKLHTNFYIL